MKKATIYLLGILFLFGCKTTEKSIIKSGIQIDNENSLFYSNNKNGNLIFNKNDGMNGPVTMISALEYDNLNRETKSYWVHSNLGFYLSEKEYGENQIRNYSYKSKLDKKDSYDRETLKKVKSRKDFIRLKGFTNLQEGNKYLSMIENLDSANNVIEEIFLTETGDTSSYNFHKYDSENNEISFHKRDPNSKVWNWDIYNIYDENSNLIQSFRVSFENIKDTTEVYDYVYKRDLLESKTYHHRGRFQNKTVYKYNSKDEVIEELFYENDKNEIKVKTTYKYDKKGNKIEESAIDYREEKDKQKSKTKFTFEYW